MISVCMATYNGERYVVGQINSILAQLGKDDELVVSDDGSKDKTVQLIDAINDERIRLLHGGFHSPIRNFENAIKNTKGDVIILADQDDLWLPGRVDAAMKKHNDVEHPVMLAFCRAQVIDENGNIVDDSRYNHLHPTERTFFRNLIRNHFMGCCMSFKRELLDYILPFPKGIMMHDSWIGLVAQFYFNCELIGDEPYMQYRRYGTNFTELHQQSLWHKIEQRFRYMYHILRVGVKNKVCKIKR